MNKSRLAGSLRLKTACLIQVRVIIALIIRDMMLRYGRNNLGFVWVVLEPMILTIGVMILWAAAKAPVEHGVPIVALVLSGYMPLTLWRHTSNNGIFLLRRAMGTLYHRRVSALDVIASRMLTEIGGVTLAFVVVYGTLFSANLVDPIYDGGALVTGWLLLAGLGASFALLVAGGTEFSETIERFIQPFQYLIIPISGAFFMVDWLPHQVQEFIWFNPLIHCYEIFRDGFFGPKVTTHYSIWYPILWIEIMTFAGLWLLGLARNNLSGQ